MTDTTAALEDRYVARWILTLDGIDLLDVYDTYENRAVRDTTGTWDAAHAEAQRLNREARAANNPAVPSCDFAARLKAAEETAERYRNALAQIIRYTDCRTALAQIIRYTDCRTANRYAATALFVADRMKEELP